MIRRWRDRGRREDTTPPPAERHAPGRNYRISLVSQAPGIKLARRITETLLTTWGLPAKTSVHDAAVLAVTELATNAARHAAHLSPYFELMLSLTDNALDVAVRDSHPGLIDLSAKGTGGLAVLADLACDFGGALAIDADSSGGKTIHIVLPLPAPTTTPEK